MTTALRSVLRLACVSTLAALAACGVRLDSQVTVVNQATSPLAGVTVEAGSAVIWSGRLEPGQRATATYTSTGDAAFQLRGRLQDGTSVQSGPLGYTTPGDGQEHVLTVSRDGSVGYTLGGQR